MNNEIYREIIGRVKGAFDFEVVVTCEANGFAVFLLTNTSRAVFLFWHNDRDAAIRWAVISAHSHPAVLATTSRPGFEKV